jgi:hypothetical protein
MAVRGWVEENALAFFESDVAVATVGLGAYVRRHASPGLVETWRKAEVVE